MMIKRTTNLEYLLIELEIVRSGLNDKVVKLIPAIGLKKTLPLIRRIQRIKNFIDMFRRLM